MFSGKTSALIARLEEAARVGKRVAACKHAYDDRYDIRQLATHDGRAFAAQAVPDAAGFAAIARSAEVVGLDEAQFFGTPLVDACQRLVAAGVRVIVAGIDHDAWGRPFPPLPALKALADEVVALTSPCRVCGAPAKFSQRMQPIDDPRMVGGLADYEPRCDACFTPLPEPAPVCEQRQND